MNCKLCGENKPLIKAHIIPKSFYGIKKTEKSPMRILSSVKDFSPQISHIGIYDKSILCLDCEKILSPLDDYAYRLLKKGFLEFEKIIDRDEIVAYTKSDYDYHKLKLFFLSVLWRSSVTKNFFFKKVNLGPHEEKIAHSLKSNNSGNTEFYSTFVCSFDDAIRTPTMCPIREKWSDINYYRLYLSFFTVLIKVDSRPAPDYWMPFHLSPEKPLYIINRSLDNSPEFQKMLKVVKQHNN